MKRRFNKFSYHPWFRACKRVCGQFIVPFIIFQFIRTLILPTVFDILLLTLFISIGISIYFDVV